MEVPVSLNGKNDVIAFVPYLSAIQIYTKGKLTYEYFETKKTVEREFFPVLIEQESVVNKVILEGCIRDFDNTSWFCVNWVPIPLRSGAQITGEFLTFYVLNQKINLLGVIPTRIKLETWFDKKNDEFMIPYDIIRLPLERIRLRRIIHHDFNIACRNNWLVDRIDKSVESEEKTNVKTTLRFDSK